MPPELAELRRLVDKLAARSDFGAGFGADLGADDTLQALERQAHAVFARTAGPERVIAYLIVTVCRDLSDRLDGEPPTAAQARALHRALAGTLDRAVAAIERAPLDADAILRIAADLTDLLRPRRGREA